MHHGTNETEKEPRAGTTALNPLKPDPRNVANESMFGLFKKRAPVITEPHESNIVPRIKNTQFLTATRDLGAQGLEEPATEPFAGDLIVAYAFDMPHMFHFASRRQCAELGLEGERLRTVALQNLRHRVRKYKVQGKDPVFTFAVGEGRESCLMLLDEVCEAFMLKVQGELVAAVPTRDALFFTGSESELGMQIVTEAIDEFYPRGENHALTRNLLCWRNHHWEVFR